MITNIVARFTVAIFPLILFAAWLTFVVLVIIVLVRAARFFGTAKKDLTLTRMEMSKLAEEIHLLRGELKAGHGHNSDTESG